MSEYPPDDLPDPSLPSEDYQPPEPPDVEPPPVEPPPVEPPPVEPPPVEPPPVEPPAVEAPPVEPPPLEPPAVESPPLTDPPSDLGSSQQADPGCCGIEGVGSLVSDLRSEGVDHGEIVDRGASNGWLVYDDAGDVRGVRPGDMPDVLASYGVSSSTFGGPEAAPVSDDEAWQALDDSLAGKRRVVVGIDGRGFDAILGVDRDRGVVTVEDASSPGGLEVPADVFFESWRAANFSMVMTDPPISGEGLGYTVLGTTLVPDATWDEPAGELVDMNSFIRSDLASGFPAADDLLVSPSPEIQESAVEVEPAPDEPGGWVLLDADYGSLGFDASSSADPQSGEPGGWMTVEYPPELLSDGPDRLASLARIASNLRVADILLGPSAQDLDAWRREDWPMLTYDIGRKHGYVS